MSTAVAGESEAEEVAVCRAALRACEQRVERATDDVRRAVARGLHDDLGQLLATIRLGLAELARCEDPAARSAVFTRLDALMQDAVETVRTLTFELRASPPGDAVTELRRSAAWITQVHGLPCEFRAGVRRLPIAGTLAATIRSVSRELLVNVARHAHATHATVSLERCADHLSFTVEDDGVGIRTGHADDHAAGGSGLCIVRERLVEVGGTLQIGPAECGTQLSVSVPLPTAGLPRTSP